jgi:hypothetical protein
MPVSSAIAQGGMRVAILCKAQLLLGRRRGRDAPDAPHVALCQLDPLQPAAAKQHTWRHISTFFRTVTSTARATQVWRRT